MLDAFALLMIFAGVAFSIYQLYDIYYDQNFGDDERHANGDVPNVDALSRLLAATTGSDETRVRQVLADESQRLSTESLRRRQQRLVAANGLRIRHLAFWHTRPPRRDCRTPLLMLILACCLAVLFVGGLSVYTIAYEVSSPGLAWVNESWVLMGVTYGLILVTHLLAKLDKYLHDLYEIGQLDRALGHA